MRALQMTQVFAVIAGAFVTGQEYMWSAQRTSFLAVPRRMTLLAVKTLATLGWVGVSFVLSLLSAILLLGVRPSFSAIVGAAGSWLGLACLAAFMAVACRSLVAPIAVLVPLVLGLSVILQSITSWAKYLPDLAMRSAFHAAGSTYLAPAQGACVLSGWVLAAAILASVVMTRSDVR